MISRRQFVGSAMAAPLASGAAPQYDLVLRGGRVIDASQKLDRIADVAISNGKIAAIAPQIQGAAEIVDVTGSLVTAGLIEVHAHLLSPQLPPSALLVDGVTTIVDGGSCGADNAGALIEILRGASNRARMLLNIARGGMSGGNELRDLSKADPEAARMAIERNRDWIIGIKARLSRSAAGPNDLEALRRARAAADPLQVPIMVHIGDSVSPLPAILALLRPGDIVTHMFAPVHGILDDKGRVLPEVREARKRGVLFDFGAGRHEHWSWSVAERALAQDFAPDTLSSDITNAGRSDQVMNIPNVLSNLLTLGMPLEEVIRRATAKAAQTYSDFRGLGTLRPGSAADIAVLEVREGDFTFVDNYKGTRHGRKKLFAKAAFFGGKRASV
jgi:dihydroorotase